MSLLSAKNERQDLAGKKPVMLLRARMMAAIRNFFYKEDFLEVFTPVRLQTPALEDYIEVVPSGKQWLRTSPEFHMKRLLAAGYPRIYQTGPCFRREECGARHLLEFTMLEWYRTGGNWLDVLKDSQNLLHFCAETTLGTPKCHFRGKELDFSQPWEQITVEEAFRKYAQVDLDQCIAEGNFELVLCEKVEPHLGINGRPTALTEYPLACSGLSRQFPGRPSRVERWEVYLCGLELGNACTELCDPVEQERRFHQCEKLREREHRDQYGIDMPFLDMMRVGLPPVAGVAIGLDRLLMALAGLDSIEDAVPFLENVPQA